MATKPKTAVIIDDEKDICLLLKHYLKTKGWAAEFAHNLKEGYDLVLEKKPDFLILDLQLPDGYGFDIVEKVKANCPDTEIIIITAYDGMYERKKSEEMQIKHFISKPIQIDRIMSVLEVRA